MRRSGGEAALLLAALIWGTCFVAQSVGLDAVGPYTFQAVRCLLGAAVLLPLSLVRRKRSPQKPPRGALLKGGIACGLVLCFATNLQQLGLQYTTPAKSGFITSMYLVLVPILSLALGRSPKLRHWICVALAAVGLYLLSVKDGFTLNPGDALTLIAAFFFAAHIMAVDRFAPGLDGAALCCVQFLVVGLLTCAPMLLLETPTLAGLHAAALPIAYAGVMSCGLAYTLQIVGQQRCEPVVATVLMSLESVFSLLGGMVILGQVPTHRELLGCTVVFGAVLLAQLPVERILGVFHEKTA